MSTTSRRSVTLSEEQARFVDEQVSAGKYASAEAVVEAGVAALQTRETAIERWLKEEVAPVYDRVKAGKEVLHSPEEVREALRVARSKLKTAAE